MCNVRDQDTFLLCVWSGIKSASPVLGLPPGGKKIAVCTLSFLEFQRVILFHGNRYLHLTIRLVKSSTRRSKMRCVEAKAPETSRAWSKQHNLRSGANVASNHDTMVPLKRF